MNPKRTSGSTAQAAYVEPMDCLTVATLPTGSEWTWEIKLDGYRALAVKAGDKITLYSRLKNSLNAKFPYIVEPLAVLPNDTVIDGELVALNDDGRPEFNLLQKFRSASNRIHYKAFDLLFLKGKDLRSLPLNRRRKLLRTLRFPDDRVEIVEYAEADSSALLAAARKQNLEGIVGKRKDSQYESGLRTGAWIKHRLNRGQEFVIGGYIPGSRGVDSIVIGYYKNKELIYCARIRNGFVPAARNQLLAKLARLKTSNCAFSNLPETQKTRWGEGFTADKMRKAVWVKPQLVAQIEFLEWTPSGHLRHAKFTRLRDDKNPLAISKEKS